MKKILIADDEEHIAKLVQFKLKHSGFDTRVTSDGEAAYHAFLDSSWDLVILDVMMPKMTGWETLRSIRSHEATISSNQVVPVLMLTAKTLKGDLADFAEVEALFYLKKPFDPNELAKKVKEIVDGV